MRTAATFGPAGGLSVRERILGGLMDQFLVEAPHAEQNCRNVDDLVNRAGYLNHFAWSFMGGVHCGWAIIGAENDPHARLAVPPLGRAHARMFKIVKFSQLMLNSRHQQ